MRRASELWWEDQPLLDLGDRAALGRLWLPWCVDVDRHDVPIHIGESPGLIARARQVRVSDVDAADVQTALSRQSAPDGSNSLAKIQGIANDWRDLETVTLDFRTVSPDAPGPCVFAVEDGYVLKEGCHRTCALYLSAPRRIRFVAERQAAWPTYLDVSRLSGIS